AAAALGYVKPIQAENYFCQQQFALCTSAPCIPEPGNPKIAICTCDVEEGPNLATVACDAVKPSTDANGIRTVYSQFALKQFAQGKRTLKCAAGTPWTWCLNKPCTVDPANPKKAICACDVLRTGEWITAGGNCNTATCNTADWSGAPLNDFNDGTDFFVKQLKLKKSPVNWCRPKTSTSRPLRTEEPTYINHNARAVPLCATSGLMHGNKRRGPTAMIYPLASSRWVSTGANKPRGPGCSADRCRCRPPLAFHSAARRNTSRGSGKKTGYFCNALD